MIKLKNGRVADTFWDCRGILHSINDIPIIDPDGTKKWYWRGYISRRNGPAIVEPDGSTRWYDRGILHRKDGPAVTHPNMPDTWYVYGKRTRNFREFQELSKCPDEDIITLKLKYGDIHI